jgi:hypothetical protein
MRQRSVRRGYRDVTRIGDTRQGYEARGGGRPHGWRAHVPTSTSAFVTPSRQQAQLCDRSSPSAPLRRRAELHGCDCVRCSCASGVSGRMQPTRSQRQSARCAVCRGFRSISSPERVQIVTFGGNRRSFTFGCGDPGRTDPPGLKSASQPQQELHPLVSRYFQVADLPELSPRRTTSLERLQAVGVASRRGRGSHQRVADGWVARWAEAVARLLVQRPS